MQQYFGIISSNRIFFSWVCAIPLVLFMILGASAWKDQSIPMGKTLFLVGVVLVGIGVLGRAWSLLYIAGKKKIELITQGPYSLCRNPLYFFSFLMALGAGLCTETFIIPSLVACIFLIIYMPTIKKEENFLRRKFKHEYESYAKVTPRFLPLASGFIEPARIEVNAKAFRLGLDKLIIIIAFLGIIEFLEGLHMIRILPTLFVIY